MKYFELKLKSHPGVVSKITGYNRTGTHMVFVSTHWALCVCVFITISFSVQVVSALEGGGTGSSDDECRIVLHSL